MRICAQVVCVDYAEQWAKVKDRWIDSLDHLLVITAERDEATLALCDEGGCQFMTTDVFWANGAAFNKGAAMSQGFDALWGESGEAREYPQFADYDDVWHLFIDADALPPTDWRRIVEDTIDHRGGRLYGTHRVLESGVPIREGELAGSFHLAKITDPQMLVRPIVDVHWSHAGNYDSTFQTRWAPQNRVRLPITLTHIGQPFTNWCGVGHAQEMQELFAERRRLGGWHHETIKIGKK